MKNMFYVQERRAYDEEVSDYAYGCFENMASVEDLNNKKWLSVEEIAKDFIECAKEAEDNVDSDFHLKTEAEAWEVLERYTGGNYSIFSVMEFAEGVRNTIKALFEESNSED